MLCPAGSGLGFNRVADDRLRFGIIQFAADDLERLSFFALNGKRKESRDILPEVEHVAGQQRRGKAFVRGDRHVVRRDKRRGGRGDLDSLAGKTRLHEGVIYLAVLEIGKADRAVVRPCPCLVGANRFARAVFVSDFELRDHARLRAVYVRDAVGRNAAAIPAVGKAQLDGVVLLQVCRYIVGLVLDALAVIGHAGGKEKILDALAVDRNVVDAACRGIEPCGRDLAFCGERFAEAIDRITARGIGPIVTRNPFCRPVGSVQKTEFKNALAHLPRLAVLVPKRDRPCYTVAAHKRLSFIPDMRHAVGCDLAGIPNVLAALGADDLIGGLLFAALTVPRKARRGVAEAERGIQIFGL